MNNNYDNIYDDDQSLGTEQQNKGQGIDPFGVAKDINDINNRIKNYKNINKENDLLNDKEVTGNDSSKSGEIDSKNQDSEAKKVSNDTSKTAKTTDTAKATEEGIKEASKTASAGTAATTAGATAGAGTASTGVASASIFANPTTWIIIGAAILLLIIIIIVVITSSGTALGEGTGTNENALIGYCEEDDTECQTLVEYMNGEASELASIELYYELLAYCKKNQTFGEKATSFFSTIFNGMTATENGCDLANVIENTIKAKEIETGVRLSRGLAVATIQLLYDGIPYMEDVSEEGESSKVVDSSSPAAVLENVAKSGMINAKDIEAIVDNMVFKIDYSYYEWGIVNEDNEYNCKERYNKETKEWEKYDCKTKITYGCTENAYEAAYTSLQKYFIFLRYGGSYTLGNHESSGTEKALWNTTTVGYDKIIGNRIEAVGKNKGLVLIRNQMGTYLDGIIDPATSFQEITNYNESLEVTSDECKIEGMAEESLPKSTEDIIYEVDRSSINESVNSFGGEITPIDTLAYEVDPENIKESVNAAVIVIPKNGCKLNNLGSGTDRCEITSTNLSYKNGFLYWTYPQYKYSNQKNNISDETITGKLYEELGKSIEGQLSQMDEYEDHLNEIFGFDQFDYSNIEIVAGRFAGSGTSGACLEQESLSIILYTCPGISESKKKEYSSHLPGGYTSKDGKYYAKSAITMEQYIKGVTAAEVGGYFYVKYNEGLKFMMVAFKSYALSKLDGYEVIDGKTYIPIGSSCSQNYKDYSKLDFKYKSVIDSAYNAIKTKMIYNSSNEILRAEYRSTATKNLMEASLNVKSYEELLSNSSMNKYAAYSTSKFGDCSTTTQTGYDFVSNARSFLGWTNKRFISSEYVKYGYSTGSAWCARFVDMIKSLTPNANSKIGSVPSKDGVKYWIRHFATSANLSFCASETYPNTGCYKNGVKYSGSYIPKAGDIIFYAYQTSNGVRQSAWNGNPLASEYQDHVGIVSSVYKSGNRICIDTIEGNVGGKGPDGNSVKEYRNCQYYTSHKSILGYGIWE